MVEIKMIELTEVLTGAKVKVNAAMLGYCKPMKMSNGEVHTWVQVSGCGSMEVMESPSEIVAKMEHF